jgi:Tfp pilus assembly protein PilO
MSSLLFPLLSVSTAIVLFFFFLRPTYGEIGAAREEVAHLRSTLDSAQEIQLERDRLVSKYNAIPVADLERLEKILPDHVDNVRLILEIDTVAKGYGMTLNDLIITESKQIDSSNSSTKGVGGAGTAPLGIVTFSFRTSSSYETFLQFLQDLEHSLRIVDITSLSFTPGGRENTKSINNYYTFTVTLQAYWSP